MALPDMVQQLREWLLFIRATTGLPFVAVGFGELINVNTMDWANWEGKAYVGFSLPLLIAGLLLSHANAREEVHTAA